ncbi:hypothetical protein HDU98_003603 [Podochytrium sp. JEL0797]|nr:hypothetical protein HDU98_003603 [Podochytrium sp. JEL0797]
MAACVRQEITALPLDGTDGQGSTRQPALVVGASTHSVTFNGGTVSTFQVSAHSPGRHLFKELCFVFSHYGEHCLAAGLDANNDNTNTNNDPSRPNVARLLKRKAAPVMNERTLLVVQTFQRSASDLMVVTDESNTERNLLLECFSAWGRFVVEHIRAKGFWADMTDPCSGYPVYTPRGTSLYPDVDGAARLLKYATHLVGCCRIISHPVW